MVLNAATLGGAVVPPIMSPVNRSRSANYAFVVVVGVFAFGVAAMPAYLQFCGTAKKQVDPMLGKGGAILGEAESTGRARRVFSAVVRRKRAAGRNGSAGSGGPSSQHVESPRAEGEDEARESSLAFTPLIV